MKFGSRFFRVGSVRVGSEPLLSPTLNPYVLQKEVPLQEALGKHAERAAMKKGVKDKAILCGVGAGSSAAHEDDLEYRPSV